MRIRSTRVLINNSIQPATIVIEGAAIKNVQIGEFANLHIDTDYGDKIIMPGVIDPHVHINEPGRTDWEGFDTATRSALAGGITTLVDMPLNSSPVTTTTQAFDEKLKAARKNAHCNLGFWGGLIPGNEKEIQPLIDKGVLGFKAFLVPSGIDEFPNVGERELRKCIPIIAGAGLPLLVHCELTDNSPFSILNPQSYSEYLNSRPKSWEDNAIALMIKLCEEYNCRVHIVHLSSADSIAQIQRAKEKGLPLTVETCPHYLHFNAEDIPDGHTEYKCAPPIREKENRERLWKALKEGVIDFVATDHSPAPPELKELLTGDLFKAWGGIASLQLSLPVLWTAAKERAFTISDIAKWLCEMPARLPGLDKNKGKLEAGFDADLVVWDPEKSFKVTPEILNHRHKITPYMNQTLNGVVEQVYLAGEKLFEQVRPDDAVGQGKFLHLNKGKIWNQRLQR
jgi:allantoinase